MKIVIFAGTSEGKATANLLAEKGHELFVTVATEYGKCIFEESLTQQNVHLLEGRLTIGQMEELIESADLAVDATHPYATEVSKNIVKACTEKQKPYLRILRANQNADDYEDVILWANDPSEAIGIMNRYDGRVLLTTGSKDLPKYTAVKNYTERLFPRILPDMVSLQIAMDNDYKKKNIICMQGPFTEEVNASMLKMIGAEFLLTKETGESGGYYEKLSACRMANAKAIVIKRPPEEIDTKAAADLFQSASITVAELNAFLEKNGSGDFLLEDLKKYKENTRNRQSNEKNLPSENRSEHILSEPSPDITGGSEKNSEQKNKSGISSQASEETTDSYENRSYMSQKNERPIEIRTKLSDISNTGENLSASEQIQRNEMSDVTVPKISFETVPRFPIFLDLKGRSVTVIGSGNIARRRIKALLGYGAKVRVISPNASNNLEMAGILDWEKEIVPKYRGSIETIDRRYQEGDLEGALIAVTATDDREVNHRVYQEACARGIFISVADKKDESSYFFPATWLGDGLSIGIVGDGTDHRYVRRSAEEIRKMLDKMNLTPKRGTDEKN